MIRAVIIDDDEVARKILVSYIERTSDLVLCGEFKDAAEAIDVIEDKNIDLFFLDVEMPEMSGFDFLNYGKDKLTEVILVTSKEKYAVQAFQYDIADYLVKPIDYSRFLQAVRKAKDNIEDKEQKLFSCNALFVKDESLYERVELDDIKWVEASGDYVTLVSEEKTHLIHTTMKLIERHLPSRDFVRVHRSYIINICKLDNFDKEFCVINKKMIPIGKSYRKELLAKLNII